MSLTRKVRVVWGAEERAQNFGILRDTLEFLDGQGFGMFSLLYDPGEGGKDEMDYSSLVLVERKPSIGQNDPCVVDVELKYDHILDGPNQLISSPPLGVIYGKGRCSIVEKSTNFFFPYGDKSQKRIQIMVGHKYEDTDSSVAGFTLVNQVKLPKVAIQGGEINIPFPQGNFQCEGIKKDVDDPWGFAMTAIAKLNRKSWLGQRPHCFLCTEVSWQMLNWKVGTYRFAFEFQYNDDTWDTSVVFLDQRTGRPPAKVVRGYITDPSLVGGPYEGRVLNYQVHPNYDALNVEGQFPAGVWQVPALAEIDFNEFFVANFEGLAGDAPDPAEVA